MSTYPMQDERYHRIIIIGAGPGGLQLAYDLERAKVDYLVLERAESAGSFFERLPVHRKLLSINKPNTGSSDVEKNLRWDWNSLLSDIAELRLENYDRQFFPQADSLVLYFRDFCTKAGLRVRFNSNVRRVEKSDEGFIVFTVDNERFACEVLVVSSGLHVPYIPAIEGIELTERYESYDARAEGLRNKDVLIIGKGNSAFETADACLPYAAHIHLISPNYLRMASQSHYVGHLRQINSPFLDTFILKQQNAVLNGTINRIERFKEKFAVNVKFAENGHEFTFEYDRVIACTGYRFDTDVFGCGVEPELVSGGRLPDMTCHWESTNIRNLYFCGTLMQTNDRKSASAFVHGIRYNARILSRFLECRLGVREYPHRILPLEPEAIVNRIYERLRVTSSLWHLHGTLCDAYLFSDNPRHFVELQDLPVKVAAEDHAFLQTSRIEFRFTFDNPADPNERKKFSPGGLLHPAVYLFVNGLLVAEQHMYEDVYAEWERNKFGFCFEDVLPGYIDAIASAAGKGLTPSCVWPGSRVAVS